MIDLSNKNALKSVKSRLEIRWEMRRRLILQLKQDFVTKSLSRPPLSTAEYSSGYLRYISNSTICFWIDWVCVYKYTQIKGLDSREITSLPEIKNLMNNSASFYSWPNINCMLITRLICIQQKFSTPNHTDFSFFDHTSIHLFQK